MGRFRGLSATARGAGTATFRHYVHVRTPPRFDGNVPVCFGEDGETPLLLVLVSILVRKDLLLECLCHRRLRWRSPRS